VNYNKQQDDRAQHFPANFILLKAILLSAGVKFTVTKKAWRSQICSSKVRHNLHKNEVTSVKASLFVFVKVGVKHPSRVATKNGVGKECCLSFLCSARKKKKEKKGRKKSL